MDDTNENKKDDKKPIDLPLDRYEIVAIAVPGAALVAVATWYLNGKSCLPPDITKLTLGGLGLFTIASFVAGHVVQSIANSVEDAWRWWRGAPEMIPPLKHVPLAYEAIEKSLDKLNLKCPESATPEDKDRVLRLPVKRGGIAETIDFSLIGNAAKELRRLILSRVRAANRSRLLDNLKISIAVNRGLCVVSVLCVLVEVRQRVIITTPPMPITVLAAGVIVLVGLFSSRYRYTQLLKSVKIPIVAKWFLLALAFVIVMRYCRVTGPATDGTFLATGIVIALVSGARARRYTMQFEREIWVQFGESSYAVSKVEPFAVVNDEY